MFDRREIDYKKYHRNDKALGLYKFYQLFLLHKCGVYAHDDSYALRVFLDQRSDLTPIHLDTIRIILNRSIRLRYGRSTDVVQGVESLESHTCDLMQLADVLMGAVGYHCNDLHRRADSTPARKALAEYIARQSGVQPLSKGTHPRRADFGIWRFKRHRVRARGICRFVEA